jgi:hypothetical protein
MIPPTLDDVDGADALYQIAISRIRPAKEHFGDDNLDRPGFPESGS